MERDLQHLFAQINKTFFKNQIKASIKWGKQKTPSVWGLYYDESKEIIINPLLQLAWVPLDFLRYIIYHEMLHQIIPSIEKPHFSRHHTPTFREKELQFPQAKEMEDWENKNIHRFRRIKSDFRKHCHKFGLSPNDLGRSISIENKKYYIIGLYPWSQQYPIVLRNPQGRLLAEEARYIKYLLSKSRHNKKK